MHDSIAQPMQRVTAFAARSGWVHTSHCISEFLRSESHSRLIPLSMLQNRMSDCGHNAETPTLWETLHQAMEGSDRLDLQIVSNELHWVEACRRSYLEV